MEYTRAGRVPQPGAVPYVSYLVMNFSHSNGPFKVVLFDMEPPDVSDGLFIQNKKCSAHAIAIGMNSSPINLKFRRAIRIRGGTNPNVDKKWSDIPSLTLVKFQWDGIPKVDFQELVLFPLNAGLGSISMNGNTLLAAVRRRDAGGVFGNPPRAAASNEVVEQSDQRIERAAACILNYISSNSMIYKLFQRSFNLKGDAIYRFICAYGPLPTPQKILTARDDAWSHMSMDRLNMYYTANNYLKWMQIVQEQGRIMIPPKTGQQMKDKFISGLPDSVFKDVKIVMSRSNLVHPATLGGLPYYAVTPLAGNANPLSGQPNVDALARAFFPEWIQRIVATQKGMHVPSGLVRSVLGPEYCDTDSPAALAVGECDEDTETVFMLAKDVTSKTICIWCGGMGHPTSYMKDGIKYVCPSKTLGTITEPVNNGASKHTAHSSTTTPNLDKMEKKLSSYKAQVQELKDMVYSLSRSTKDRSFRPKSPTVRAAYEEDSDESDGNGGSEAGHSTANSTDQSEVEDFDPRVFAEALSPKGKGKKRYVPPRR